MNINERIESLRDQLNKINNELGRLSVAKQQTIGAIGILQDLARDSEAPEGKDRDGHPEDREQD